MAWAKVGLTADTYTNDDGTRTAQRVYKARQTEGSTHNAADARFADDGTNAIPAVGDAYASGDPAKATKVTARKLPIAEKTKNHFEVTVDYSSATEDQPQIENPLSRPPTYSYSGAMLEEPYFRDVEAQPMTNSAGEEFQDLPVRLKPAGSVTITRNVASYNDATARTKQGRINAGTVTINGVSYPERTLLIGRWDANGPNVENDVTYWTESVELLKAPEGRTWDDELEDRGRNELDGGNLVPITDGEENPVDLPWPLDGAGSAKAAPTDAPAVLTRKPYATFSGSV